MIRPHTIPGTYEDHGQFVEVFLRRDESRSTKLQNDVLPEASEHQCQALIDTGSVRSFVDLEIARRLRVNPYSVESVWFLGTSGQTNCRTYPLEVYLSSCDDPPLCIDVLGQDLNDSDVKFIIGLDILSSFQHLADATVEERMLTLTRWL